MSHYDQSHVVITNSIPSKINWVTTVKGNFSFRHKWEYPEGVYKNKYGQLSCDGNCPTEIDNMIDQKGKIKKDSIKSFYKIVDTSHLYHSISSTAWCYEWDGTDFIEAKKQSIDTIVLKTEFNVSTHCSLHLIIVGDYCYPLIDLNSIVSGGGAIYYCTGGYISIDKILWEKGIVKATFNFKFKHDENPKKPIFWKGKIYSQIQKEYTNR